MSLIQRPVMLVGPDGRAEVIALFDSGADYSCIAGDLARSLGPLAALPEPQEFETADRGDILTATHRIDLDLYFPDSRRRFSDEFVIIETLAEDLIIGAHSLQPWRVGLDFEHDEVIYDRRARRLRI